jgi:epoxyqueuosine reductase
MIPFALIKEKALELGWDDAGATEAVVANEDIDAWKTWLEEGQHGTLHYMENPHRGSPDILFPGAKFAIIFVTYYKQEKLPFTNDAKLIASYARGKDYHNIHRKRLKKMIAWLEELSGKEGIARGFSDSFPLLEKGLAVKAGLGWFGKNTLLIHPKFGTFTLLSGLLTSLEIAIPQTPNLRLPKCGTCTKCLDACPTSALVSPYKLDARLCLSYHLIESKGEVPQEIRKKNPGYAFGCDICQDVCPHNVRKPLSEAADFSPERGMGTYLDSAALNELEKEPQRLFGSPLNRRGVEGLKENLKC